MTARACSTTPEPRLAPRARRVARALLLVVVASVTVLLASGSPASAHASFIESEPPDGGRVGVAPDRVVLRYSEPVTITGPAVRVLGTDGRRVDDGRPVANGNEVTVGIDGPLEPDTYIVAWRVVSADDHPVHGATTFVVGDGPTASDDTIARLLGDEGDGAWPTLGAGMRTLAYAGGLLVIGAVAWTVAVERGVVRRPVGRIAIVGAVVGGVGALLTVPVQAALSTGLGLDAVTDTEILSDVADGPLGVGVVLVAVGLAIAAVVLRRPRRAALSADTATAGGLRAISTPLAIAGALLIAVGFARSGHTETTDPRALMFGADVLHVVAAGTWAGGLVLLAGALRAARSGRVAPSAVATRVARFSTTAAVVSIATGVSGVVLAWGTVRSIDNLTSTDYGRVLLVKVGLVVLVGIAAVINHFWLVPAVNADRPDSRQLLLRTVLLEAAVLLAVVVVTSSLVNLEPARVAAGRGMFEDSIAFGDGTAVIQVDPAKAGVNDIHLYLIDKAGRQLELPEDPTFSLRLEKDDIGPIVRTPWRAGPGHYILNGPEMSLKGKWILEIRARLSTFDEATATVEIPIR